MANYCYKVMFGTLVLGLIAFLIVNVRQHVLAQGQLKLVRTLTGPVRGERRLGSLLNDARPYYAFRGIPYAERPIGPHRFKPAIPVRPWKAVRTCYEQAAICMQLSGGGAGGASKPEVIGSEDCLYLNVYTPDVDPPADQLRAVLVWLPGDDWFTGSASDAHLGPEFLTDQDVLVVTIASRLGVLGYLNLDVPEVPGNQGLGDQQLALEWVYENVRLFGGDQQRITLGGAGAGAMAAHLHQFAERSTGLFGRTIQMGTSWSQWQAFQRPAASALHSELMAMVRRTQTRRVSSADLVNELQALDARQLVAAFGPKTHGWLGPSVERAQVQYPFLRVTAMDWRLEVANWTGGAGGKDMLAGSTTAEALAVAGSTAAAYEQFRADAAAAMPLPFERRAGLTAEAVWQRLAAEYFANGTAQATREEYVRFVGDLLQRYLVDRRVRWWATREGGGRVFRYRFGLDTQLNVVKRWTAAGVAGAAATAGARPGAAGAAHGDDLCYVFRCEALAEMYANVTAGSRPYAEVVRMSRAWATFVRSGQPEVEATVAAAKATPTVEAGDKSKGVKATAAAGRWRPMNGAAASEADEAADYYMDIGPDGWVEWSGEFAAERRVWQDVVQG